MNQHVYLSGRAFISSLSVVRSTHFQSSTSSLLGVGFPSNLPTRTWSYSYSVRPSSKLAWYINSKTFRTSQSNPISSFSLRQDAPSIDSPGRGCPQHVFDQRLLEWYLVLALFCRRSWPAELKINTENARCRAPFKWAVIFSSTPTASSCSLTSISCSCTRLSFGGARLFLNFCAGETVSRSDEFKNHATAKFRFAAC